MGTRSDFEEQVGYDELVGVKYDYDNHDPRQIKYGRITTSGHAMIPISGTPYRSLTPEDSTVFALDFVADAFRDLNSKYNDMGLDLFNSDGQGNIVPHRAYEDPTTLYRQYIEDLLSKFVEEDLMSDSDLVKISKFSEYIDRLKKYMSLKPNVPYLFSSYVKSSLCPPHVSGLVIELDRVQHGDINEKYRYSQEVEITNFSFLAKKFGFVVPKQSPWCLVANLNSTIMYNYALEYDIPSRKEFVSSYFIQCRNYDIDLLRSAIVQSYSSFIEETSVRLKKSLCEEKGLVGRIKLLNPPEIDPTVTYDTYAWIDLYFRILSVERRKKHSKLLFDKVIKDCYYVIENFDFERMHDYGLSKLELKTVDKYR